MSRRPLSEVWPDVQRRGLIAFGGAGLASLLLALFDGTAWLQGWLFGFLFWIAFGLGALGLVMLHHLTGGAWGMAIRRMLEGATRTLGPMALMFAPIALAVGLGWAHGLYPWSDPAQTEASHHLAHKTPYLNAPFFLARAALYFVVWLVLARLLLGYSERLDRTGDARLVHRMRVVSGPGVALYGLTMTFAAIDWAMSLEPLQFSTIYGVRFVVGQVLTTMAFAIVLADGLSHREPFARWITASHFHDLGKLLFAFVMLWAYVAFSDFLIIWSGNLSEETPWYLRRMNGAWGATAAVLIGLHFFLPFFVLLSRKTKRNPWVLSKVAAWILVMRVVDFYWVLVPGFEHRSWLVYVQIPLCMTAIGGFWLAMFARGLQGRPLLSLHDAHLEGELESAVSAG